MWSQSLFTELSCVSSVVLVSHSMLLTSRNLSSTLVFALHDHVYLLFHLVCITGKLTLDELSISNMILLNKYNFIVPLD